MTMNRGAIMSLIKKIHKQTGGTGMKDDVPAMITPKQVRAKMKKSIKKKAYGQGGRLTQEEQDVRDAEKLKGKTNTPYLDLLRDRLVGYVPHQVRPGGEIIDRRVDEGTFSQAGEVADLNAHSKEDIDTLLSSILSQRYNMRGENDNVDLYLDGLARFYRTLQARAKGRDYPSKFAEGGMPEMPMSQPAALSEGEYVIPADVVSMLGDGNSDAGAKILEQFIKQLRQQKGKHLAKGQQAPSLT